MPPKKIFLSFSKNAASKADELRRKLIVEGKRHRLPIEWDDIVVHATQGESTGAAHLRVLEDQVKAAGVFAAIVTKESVDAPTHLREVSWAVEHLPPEAIVLWRHAMDDAELGEWFRKVPLAEPDTTVLHEPDGFVTAILDRFRISVTRRTESAANPEPERDPDRGGATVVAAVLLALGSVLVGLVVGGLWGRSGREVVTVRTLSGSYELQYGHEDRDPSQRLQKHQAGGWGFVEDDGTTFQLTEITVNQIHDQRADGDLPVCTYVASWRWDGRRGPGDRSFTIEGKPDGERLGLADCPAALGKVGADATLVAALAPIPDAVRRGYARGKCLVTPDSDDADLLVLECDYFDLEEKEVANDLQFKLERAR